MRSLSTLEKIVALMLAVVVVVGLVLWSGLGSGGGSSSTASGAAPTVRASAGTTVALADLPPEARVTVRRIQKGGPFPFSRDGAVFGNREGLLPSNPSGYYHEYTVTTPGSADRGPRRIVSGAGGELYFSADHYASFRQILVGAS